MVMEEPMRGSVCFVVLYTTRRYILATSILKLLVASFYPMGLSQPSMLASFDERDSDQYCSQAAVYAHTSCRTAYR